jgi:hypothetical protein
VVTAPHDRPTATELVEAVREWISGSQVAGDIEPNPFHARVAANMLAIVERELALGSEQHDAHVARLAQLGVRDDRELAAAIRSGQLDDRAAEVRRLVWDSVRAKLAVANPKYLDRVET